MTRIGGPGRRWLQHYASLHWETVESVIFVVSEVIFFGRVALTDEIEGRVSKMIPICGATRPRF